MSDDFYQEAVDKFIFKVKKGLLYTEDDLWIMIKDGEAVVGVADFLQRRSGDVTFIELPEKGSNVKRGEEIFSFETIKAAVSLASPFDGVVVDVNSKLNDAPELINADPFGEGWIALIVVPNLEDDKRDLLTAERYFELMKSRLKVNKREVNEQKGLSWLHTRLQPLGMVVT